MYASGAEHWIKITIYYAKPFLAQDINTLSGKSSYVIREDKSYCDNNVLNALWKNRKRADNRSYLLEVDFDLDKGEGCLIFSRGRLNSHKEIWRNHTKLDLESLGLTKLTSEEIFDNDVMHLSRERNIENYSFESYKQIDFNLVIDNFKSYFARDYIKKEKDLVFDAKAGIVMGAITELYRLYNNLSVRNLPLELENHKYIASYMIQNEELKVKLLEFISGEFKNIEKYLREMDEYYSN